MLRSQDASSAVIELKQDGSLVVLVGSVEVGAGTTTVAAQIAAEELGVDPEMVTVVYGDTETSPYDGGTVGSRSTFIMGNAVRRAARDVRDALFETAAEEFEVSPEDLIARDGYVRVRGSQDRGIAIGDLSFLNTLRSAPRGHRPRHVSARYRSRPAYRWARGLSSRRHHHGSGNRTRKSGGCF